VHQVTHSLFPAEPQEAPSETLAFSSLSLLQSSFKMSKIIVFSKDAFEGRAAEFKNDVHSLEEKGFNDKSHWRTMGSILRQEFHRKAPGV
jgi:hypothetical protein